LTFWPIPAIISSFTSPSAAHQASRRTAA
jgi:hypothetical protein